MNKRSDNIKGSKKRPRDRQEFFSIIHCSECGAPVIHVRSSKGGVHYWRCRTAEKKYLEETCEVHGFREISIGHTCLEAEKDLKWLLQELEGIQEFKPDRERIEHRLDIFSRFVEKGIIHADGRVVYELKFGMQLTATGNEKMAWRLRKKGKPRKKKK